MKATVKAAKVSTRKVRLVADVIRNQSVEEALKTLTLTKKHGASILVKVLQSAVANAVVNNKMQASNLVIDQLIVNEGQFLKRFRASTRGRVHGYKKRTSHVTVVLKEKEVAKIAEPKAEVKNETVEKVEVKKEENK